MINISLCILAKNEATCIFDAISSVKEFVNEVLIIDDHSTDDTVSIATLSGARVITLPFKVEEKGFAEAANWMIKQSKFEWVFILDADELLSSAHLLHTLTRYRNKEVWAFPRRKWLRYPITRTEYERYPDWQVRFFKKNDKDHFTGQMHVRYICPKIFYTYNGPYIEHRQLENRFESKVSHRDSLYPKLASLQGVSIQGGDLLGVD